MKSKSIRKRLILVMATVLVVSLFGASFAASTFSDLSEAKWASPTIQKWMGYDLVGGYTDGTFRPNTNITRAEFAVIAYKAFDLESKGSTNFGDVKASDWYYTQVVGMAKLGYIKGYTDGTFMPNKPITRAEAAAIIANIQGLTAAEEGAKMFNDFASIPTWARGHVGASAIAKYITGYSDGAFRAMHTITRAETVAMLNNAVYGANYFANSWRVVEKGIYGGTADKPVTVKGNVYIKSADVELKNVIIEGNLIFGREIGEGNATIDGVVVKGDTKVYGGGISSIYVKNSDITKLFVLKENNRVRIVVQGSTTIDQTLASSGVILQEMNLTSGDGFTEVNIDAFAGLTVEFIGLFDEVIIDSPNVKVIVPEGSVITSLVIKKPVDVTGTGTVTTAVVSVQGISFETAPKFIDVNSTTPITVEIAGKMIEFPAGLTTPVGTTPLPPAGGSVVIPPAPTKNYGFNVVKSNSVTDKVSDINIGEKVFPAATNLSLGLISGVYEANKGSQNYINYVTEYSNFFTTALQVVPTGKTETFAVALASRIIGYSGPALEVFTGSTILTAVTNIEGGSTDLANLTTIATAMSTATVEKLVSDLSKLYAGDTELVGNLGLEIKILDVPYTGTVAGLQAALNTAYSAKTIDQVSLLTNILSMKNQNTTITFVIAAFILD